MTEKSHPTTDVGEKDGEQGTIAHKQSIVEEVNDHLADALEHAQRYASHDEVRPSALMAFDEIQEAHEKLSEIDPTRTREDTEDDE